MRKKRTRTPVMLALAGLIASLVTFVSSGTAVAAEYIPPTQWPSVTTNRYVQTTNVSSNGNVTIECETYGRESDLVTYSSSGQIVRQLNRNSMVDGTGNCIRNHGTGNDGDIYGQPWGKGPNGNLVIGTNILAYDGSTLKWKYPVNCAYPTTIVVGADRNVYFLSGGRLIGVTPEVEPGTSQPKKVLDIPMSGSCYGLELRAFKDGIIVIGDTGRPTFYTYSGTNLGTTNYGLIRTNFQINAAGRFFNETYPTSAGLRSVKVSAYDPMTKKIAWDRTVSADGAYVNMALLHSTPDGGVVAVLYEKELVGGVQTSKDVMTLVKLNSMGGKVWSKTLPNQGADGSTYESSGQVRVDSNGNIAVVRNGKQTVNGKSGNVISIGMFDGNGNVVYDEIMSGNLDSSNVSLGFSTSGDVAIGANTLYLKATCQGSCPSYQETRLYPIKVPGLGLDYPRGEVLTREKRPATPYLALGDSYSSGEGVEPFEPGTNFSGVNECHRSDSAYARLISGTSPKIPALGVQGFRACSGAVTENIRYGPQWNEPGAQLDLPAWPDTTTQLVTLTIGGNDIGFGPTINTCALNPPACDSAFQDANTKVANLGGSLAGTYAEILKRLPNARVYVIGYPPLFAAGTGCTLGPNSDYPITESRKQQAIDLLNALNKKIKDQVDVVRAMNDGYYQRLKFVPADGQNSPFLGKHICSNDPYFHGLNLANTVYSFHPNAAGQQAYATLVANAINAG